MANAGACRRWVLVRNRWNVRWWKGRRAAAMAVLYVDGRLLLSSGMKLLVKITALINMPFLAGEWEIKACGYRSTVPLELYR